MMTNLSSIQEQPPHLSHPSSSAPTSYAPLNGLVPSSSAPSPSSQLEGYLHKRSSFLKSWTLKYFVLSHTSLLTFPSQSAYHKALLHPPSSLKRLHLPSLTLHSLSPSSHSRPFCFALQDGPREHLFSAATERERSDWVDALSRAIRGEVAKTDRGHKGRVEDVMSGKRINSNALITSSSSCSSLVSLTAFTSSSASSSLGSQTAPAEHCHSCHQPFTSQQRPIPCHRCSRAYCDSCAPHSILVKTVDSDDGERRMCNRCHDSLTQVTSGDTSERPDSRRTTKLGSDDSLDDGGVGEQQKIFISIPSPTVPPSAAPSPTHATAPAGVQGGTLPALGPLTASVSAPHPAVLITTPQVEASRELVSPAPSPGSPPPSPMSPVGVVAPAVKLTVKIPETKEKDIRVLSAEEVSRLERERRAKGGRDPNARMGSVAIGGVDNGNAGEQEKLVRRPWYACGCR